MRHKPHYDPDVPDTRSMDSFEPRKTDKWDKPVCDKCGHVHPRCDGHKLNSQPLRPCMMAPIRQLTVCRLHGGGTNKMRELSRKKQQVIKAEKAVATFGLPKDVDPHVALLEEVHRTAGHVQWLGEIVGALDEGDVVWGRTTEISKQATEFPGVDRVSEAKAHVWVELYQRERRHLIAAAKACIDAGIDERRVQLAEEQGAIVARAMTGLIAALEDVLMREGWNAEVLRTRAPMLAREQLALAAGDSND